MAALLKQTRQGYVDALIELAPQLPDLVVLDADVAKATKTCDFQQKFPARFFNCGTAEQNELSVAAGLALEGFIPFATTFAMFVTTRACDQLRNSICYPKVNVKAVGGHGGISTGGDGASHQACEDIAITRAMPNLTVLVPGGNELPDGGAQVTETFGPALSVAAGNGYKTGVVAAVPQSQATRLVGQSRSGAIVSRATVS